MSGDKLIKIEIGIKMATFSKNRLYDGTNPYDLEYEPEIDSDEVFEKVKEAIEYGADEIPEWVTIENENFSFFEPGAIDVYVYDYLSDEQIEELEKMIEEEYDEYENSECA